MRLLRFLPLALLCLIGVACKPNFSTSTTEQDFQKQLGLTTYAKIQYERADRTRITYDAFRSALDNKSSFTMEKNTDTRSVTLRINPAGTRALPLSKVKLAIPNGEAVPVLKASSLDGSAFAFSGKPTVVSFFFAECLPCIQEIPQLNALAKEHPELQFVSVTFDDRETAAKFVAQHSLRTKVVPDSSDFIDTVGVKTYPVLALVSSDGHLIDALSGAVFQSSGTEGQVEQWLKQAIGT
jgi:thiol-disulfide isomerase/thioredoxin